jgi:DNA processing protein
MTDKDIRELKRSEFPSALLEIPQPPKTLWLAGELPAKDSVYLCIVGSRKFTSYGKDACEKIIEGLRGYPIVIVSGMAVGIDSIAHKAALKAGLKTLVFPGSGLSDKALFPQVNVKLKKEILEAGGALLSEFEPDFKAEYWTFPMRNRLMAGISKAVLIIEAEEKSGTMITAKLATDYNRDLLALPGSIFSPTSKGTNKMIRLGATPVTSAEDILVALGFEVDDTAKQKSLFEDASMEEKSVLKLLAEPCGRDELVKKMKVPIAEANALLSIMEIKGLIREELGEIRAVV